jgi:glycine hydroxymethyltransferase
MSDSALSRYLEKGDLSNTAFISYLANLTQVANVTPSIAKSIVSELEAQRSNLKLIASENYCSLATQAAMGNLLTDKYAEGFPQHRFYAGCDNVDDIEIEACEQAKKLFGAAHAYVQPHSGADANMIAFMSVLHARVGGEVLKRFAKEKINDLTTEEWAAYRKELGSQKLIGLDYYSGGHLTHGYRFNISAQLFDAHSYKVREDNWLLDYEEISAQVKEIKPILLIAGYSAYPRALNTLKRIVLKIIKNSEYL